MKHPVQNQCFDENGVKRFKENKLISWLIDQLPNGLNDLSMAHQTKGFDDADYDQILQQIGYSVSNIPFRNKELHHITDNGNADAETHYESAYLALKEKMIPVITDLFNIHKDDLK